MLESKNKVFTGDGSVVEVNSPETDVEVSVSLEEPKIQERQSLSPEQIDLTIRSEAVRASALEGRKLLEVMGHFWRKDDNKEFDIEDLVEVLEKEGYVFCGSSQILTEE